MRANRVTAVWLVAVVALAGVAAASGGAVAGSGDAATAAGDDAAVGDALALQGNQTNGTNTTNATSGANATNATNATTNASVLPPGVSPSGVTNASALVAAHEAVLSSLGYQFEVHSTVALNATAANASVPFEAFRANVTQRGAVEPGLSPLVTHANGTIERRNRTVRYAADVWANDTTAVVRYRAGDRTAYRMLNVTGERNASEMGLGVSASLPRSQVRASVTNVRMLELVLRSGNFTVTDAHRPGNTTLLTLTASEPNASVLGFDAANVSRYEATVVVDERGLVHHVRLAFAAESDGVRYEQDQVWSLSSAGSANVTRPAWATTGLARLTPVLSMGSASSGGADYLTVTSHGGDRLPAGTRLVVRHDNRTTTLWLTEPLHRGETAYVYQPADGDGLAVSVGEPPEAGSLNGAYDVSVVAPPGYVLAEGSTAFGNGTASGG